MLNKSLYSMGLGIMLSCLNMVANAVEIADFTRCIEFTVAHPTTETLSDFPVLVRLDSSIQGFSFEDFALPGGADLRFIDLDGNLLSHEIESWDQDGSSLVWVRLPTLEKGTKFRCLYGSANPVDPLSPGTVWLKYVLVVHGGDTITNSVNNSVTATSGSDSTSASNAAGDGMIGGGIAKASNDSIGVNVSNPSLFLSSPEQFTVSAWFMRKGNGGNNNGTHILAGSQFAWDKNQGFLWLQEQGKYISIAAKGSHQWTDSREPLGDEVYTHLAFSYDAPGKILTSYLNGDVDCTRDNPGKLSNTDNYWTFGSYSGTKTKDSFMGAMDEIRIYNGVANAAWIDAEHASASASFLNAGVVFNPSDNTPLMTGFSVVPGFVDATLSISVLRFGVGADRGDVFFEIATDEAFNSILKSKSIVVNVEDQIISHSFDELDINSTYFARARFVNSTGDSLISETMSFVTIRAEPSMVPRVNMAHVAPQVSVSLNSIGYGEAITEFSIQVSSQEDFSTIDSTWTSTEEYSQTPIIIDDIIMTNLPKTSPMYYRFTAKNSRGYSQVIDMSVENVVGDDNVWSGLSSNIEDENAYIFAGGLPAENKKLIFNAPAKLSPIIDQDTEMPSLNFMVSNKDNADGNSIDTAYYSGYHSCNYHISGSGKLILSAEKVIRQLSYGTNIVDNPILFNRANNQKVYIHAVGNSVDSSALVFNGDFMLPEGVSTTTCEFNGYSAIIVLNNNTSDFMGNLNVSGGRLKITNPNAFTNVQSISFSGDPSTIENATGKALIFPRATEVSVSSGWSGRKTHLNGAPFFFPQAKFIWALRDVGQSAFNSDVVVSNLVVRKNDSNSEALVGKSGSGTFIVKGETSWYDSTITSGVKVREGCFWPQTSAGLPPSDEFFFSGNGSNVRATWGLNDDFHPMLDGTGSLRMFIENSNACCGFTAFGGEHTVCWNNDSTLNLTNTTSGIVGIKLSVDAINSLKKPYTNYYAYPAYFMFGNRSEYADGTVLFKNPIRYELGQNFGVTTYFESTNHIVAARLQGSLKLANRDKAWNFSGCNFGGYLALEADNTDFTGKIVVKEKGNLLVNSTLVGASASVNSGCGLGGTGTLTTTNGATTIDTGAAIFGGEWGKGGCLSVKGNVTLNNGSILRVEIPAQLKNGIGYVKLANTDNTKSLSINGTIKVQVDLEDTKAWGHVKIMDWTGAIFKSGNLPTIGNFALDRENAPYINAETSRLFILNDTELWLTYKGKDARPGMMFRIR